MTLPVSEIFVHHEGAGVPTDDVGRFGGAGYTVGIGLTHYAVFRDPSTDFSTYHHNHISAGICLSGDRNVTPVTASDLALMTTAVRDLHARGWVTSSAVIRPHRAVFLTACPGDHTIQNWVFVEAAVRAGLGVAPPPPPPMKEENMPFMARYPGKPTVFVLCPQTRTKWALGSQLEVDTLALLGMANGRHPDGTTGELAAVFMDRFSALS